MHPPWSYWVIQIGAHLGDAWLWALIAGWELRQAHRGPYAALHASRVYAWLAEALARKLDEVRRGRCLPVAELEAELQGHDVSFDGARAEGSAL